MKANASGQSDQKSPFVLVLKVGIPYASLRIFNFVILTAILSAANSGLYASGRMLWSLSNERTLPRCFSQLNKNGVPLGGAVGQYAGRIAGAVFQHRCAGHGVRGAVGDFHGFAVVAVWISICASHFVFRRRHLQQGKALSELHYRAPWYPLVRCWALSFVWSPASGWPLTRRSAFTLVRAAVRGAVLWCLLSPTRSRQSQQEPQQGYQVDDLDQRIDRRTSGVLVGDRRRCRR